VSRRGNPAENSESRQNDHADGDPTRRNVQQMGSQREPDNENHVADEVETKGHVEPPLRMRNEELPLPVHVEFLYGGGRNFKNGDSKTQIRKPKYQIGL